MRVAEAAVCGAATANARGRAVRAAHDAKRPGLAYRDLCDLRDTAARWAAVAHEAVGEASAELRGLPVEFDAVATGLLVRIQHCAAEAERAARFVAALATQAAPPMPALSGEVAA